MKKLRKVMYLKIARRLKENNVNPTPTIVGETTQIKGDLMSNGAVHIDGQVLGDVTCEELVVGMKGSVLGSINTKTLNLYGSAQGQISAETLFVAKTAKLIGEAVHHTIAIEPGAYIDGRCIKKEGPIHAEQGNKELLLTDERTKKAK